MELPLIAVSRESESVKSFKFSLDSVDFDYRAGQYISMRLGVADERRGIRSFTISSSPTEKGHIMISTKMTGSAFKEKLSSLSPSDKVDIRGPFGKFLLQDDLSKPAVMIAGGIGVTPFRSMIKFAVDEKLGLDITLISSNKVPEDIPFRRELEAWQKVNPRLRILQTVTRPEESNEKWDGIVGRVDEVMINRNVKDVGGCMFYVCGPPSMVDAMLGVLKSIGVDEKNIKVERFTGY